MIPEMRGQGEGSIFPRTVRGTRADGTPYERKVWTAQVTLDDGRKIQRAGPGKAEARAALAELQRHQTAETISGSRLTLRAYLEGWLDDVRPNLAPATWN